MAEQLPIWNAVGAEPPVELKISGWQPGMKPSAQHMNWLFNRAYKCIEELQDDLNPHIEGIATTAKLGHIKPDGTTITVDPSTGVASAEPAKTAAINFAKGFGLGTIVSMLQNTDWNTLDNTGFYYMAGGTMVNAPNVTNTFYVVHIKRHDNYKAQWAISNVGVFYFRASNNGVWSTWATVETTAGSQAKVDASQTYKLTNNDGTTLVPTNDTDLDTVTASGLYKIGLTVAQKGLAAGTYTFEVLRISSTAIMQRLTGVNVAGRNKVYVRTLDNALGWSAFVEQETTAGSQAKADAAQTAAIDFAKGFGLGSSVVAMSNGDANTLDNIGFYYIYGSSRKNTPTTAGDFYYYIINLKNSATYKQQLAFEAATNKMFIRYNNNGVWTAWVEQETTVGSQAKASTAEANAKNPLITLKPSTDAPSTYPLGTSYMHVGSTVDYPVGYAIIETIRTAAGRCVQFIHPTDEAGSPKRLGQMRKQTNTSTDTWSAWIEFETTAGSQLKVDTHAGDYSKHIPTAVTTGTNNAYVVTLTPTLTAYTDMFTIRIKVHADSTAAATLNVDGKGAKALKTVRGKDVKMFAGGIYTYSYNATTGNFILQGEDGGEYGTATAADVRKGNTISTDNGLVTGTLDLANVIPTNIKKSVVIDGVTGTLEATPDPSDGVFTVMAITNMSNTTSTSWLKVKELTVKIAGTYRIKTNLWTVGGAATLQLYINGSAYGTQRMNSSQHPADYFDVASLKVGDVVSISITSSSTSYWAYNTLLALSIAGQSLYANVVQGS